MDTGTCVVIFLLGGVATVIVMRLLFLFLSRAFRKNQDDQFLEQIANALATEGVWERTSHAEPLGSSAIYQKIVVG